MVAIAFPRPTELIISQISPDNELDPPLTASSSSTCYILQLYAHIIISIIMNYSSW